MWARLVISLVPMMRDGDLAQLPLVLFEDVTERQRMMAQQRTAENQLELMSTRLSLAIQPAQIGIWDYNLVTGEVIWDERMYELYGLKPDQFTGAYDSWERGVDPADKPAAEALLNEAIAGRAVFDTEFRVRHPDGSVRHVKADAMVLSDENGKASRMIGTNYDITERIIEQNKLKYRNALLRAQQEASPAGILIVQNAHSGDLCEWNLRFFGDLGPGSLAFGAPI